MSAPSRPISLVLGALGGQGGGVVVDWMTRVAVASDWLIQATSVPGVAQRTGATIYYLELFPAAALPADGRRPIMALMPSPGDVDVVVASEWVEAGRMIQRGLVTADRTTLIASTHRSYTVAEKSHPGDGRSNPAAIREEAERAAKALVAFDMDALATRNGAVISAVILGAIAASAGLPFKREAYRQAIRDNGIAVEANLRAFEAAFEHLAAGKAGADGGESRQQAAEAAVPAAFSERIQGEFPEAAWSLLRLGVARLLDYQDLRHAALYLDRLQSIAAVDTTPGSDLLKATAQGLALWMSFEDTIRVAELKTRPERLAQVLRPSSPRPGAIVELTDFLRPRVEEICGTMPAGLGAWLRSSPAWRRLLGRWTGGRRIRTSTISGYLFMRSLAGLKRWRRLTLRYREETAAMEAWLATLHQAAATDPALAVELANCQKLVRGYGETHERGMARFRQILAGAISPADGISPAEWVAEQRARALAEVPSP